MSWHKINLTWEQQASNYIEIIQDQYDKLWMSAGAPKGAAIFVSNSPGDPATIYFSPGESKIGKIILIMCKGTPCTQPQSSEAILLLGHDEDTMILATT